MPIRKYAADTQVPIGRSQDQIRQLVLGRGAIGWVCGEDNGKGMVAFKLEGRHLRFLITLSEKERETRRLWRALHMAIKAKLVIAAEGIELFDEVFLSNIVQPNGRTVGEDIVPKITTMLERGKQAPLLLSSGLEDE